jgi:hypothetical protein
MAVALGGAVYPGKSGKEIGWSSIAAGAEAAVCPAVAELFAPGVPRIWPPPGCTPIGLCGG